MNTVKYNTEVALLSSVGGLTSDDREVTLPRGQVGVVIEARDVKVVIVEFRDMEGIAFAVASVTTHDLLPLLHSPDAI